MASNEHYGIHLFAGGIGGTVGAILTCPLEVVKTRLQSSVATFQPIFLRPTAVPSINLVTSNCHQIHHINFNAPAELHARSRGTVVAAENAIEVARNRSLGVYFCLKHILKHEGVGGLFKGLGPNLVGVAPSRAIYFFCYANSKTYLNGIITPDTPLVHIAAACTAGVTACTLTNPIWLVKTRLQLDQKKNSSFTTKQCIKDIYAVHGVKGFYKGLTASYVGVSETVIHFVIYEAVKAYLLDMGNSRSNKEGSLSDVPKFMLAGAISKTTATCVAYPHEVVRTRLREEGTKYKSFVQTLKSVYKEEGRRGLYRGLVTQLIRQIPNTASMMATYELIVYLYKSYKRDDT